MTKIARIALTPGEPAGIGPDLCLQLAQTEQACEIVCIADPALLEQRAKVLQLPIKLIRFDPNKPAITHKTSELIVFPHEMASPAQPGVLDETNSEYVLTTIRSATEGCLTGHFDAMVTGPVHKGVINDAGFTFSGHTEFIAAIVNAKPVMMLATPGLRVALVTTHIPLAAVSSAITPALLEQTIRIVHANLQKWFGIQYPNILVCGLNPHAGESGHLGKEEINVIQPVLTALRNEGLQLSNALPADTLFTPKYLDLADAVIAMYHDQGLPVLKYKGFGNAVNITLGLPIIRTSVDHGTALDLAGTGTADLGSLKLALQTALDMAQQQLKPT